MVTFAAALGTATAEREVALPMDLTGRTDTSAREEVAASAMVDAGGEVARVPATVFRKLMTHCYCTAKLKGCDMCVLATHCTRAKDSQFQVTSFSLAGSTSKYLPFVGQISDTKGRMRT